LVPKYNGSECDGPECDGPKCCGSECDCPKCLLLKNLSRVNKMVQRLKAEMILLSLFA
ncbi:45262_t:CDS:1, partial [Gigaspora margarita]